MHPFRLPCLVSVVVFAAVILSACKETDKASAPAPDKGDEAVEASKKLPAPPPPPELQPPKHAVKFATEETVLCQDPAEAIDGECSGHYAKYGVKLAAGHHAWIGEPPEGTPDGAVPYFRTADQDEPSGFIKASSLDDEPDLAELNKTRETWSAIPLADRDNLVRANKDELFRIPVSSRLATPRTASVGGTPHPVFPLRVDYVGEPTPIDFAFAECLISGEKSSWISNHSCLLDATCAELRYVCTTNYCDEPIFVARRTNSEGTPELLVVAIADRFGTFVCPEFEVE